MKQTSHYGKVTDKDAQGIKVEITRYSACHNCDAKHGCGLMECKNKIIYIPTAKTDNFNKGDDVLVNMENNSGMYAVILGYILPLILMFSTLLIVFLLTDNQIKGGISAIIILIPYYLGLFLMRKRIAGKIHFTVSKIME